MSSLTNLPPEASNESTLGEALLQKIQEFEQELRTLETELRERLQHQEHDGKEMARDMQRSKDEWRNRQNEPQWQQMLEAKDRELQSTISTHKWSMRLLALTFIIAASAMVIKDHYSTVTSVPCDCSKVGMNTTNTSLFEILSACETVKQQHKFNNPQNCMEWLKRGNDSSGIYSIYPNDGMHSFKVYCDMETDGGGWTVFQRRQDGSIDFYRGWSDYEIGFGELDKEFWLGLSKIHRLTKTANTLRVDLEDFNENTRYAIYSTFSVGDVSTEYVLSVGGYSGTAGDALAWHNGMKFTTKDNDNDVASNTNCAVKTTGAWWYNNCHYSNLNGKYLGGNHTSYGDGVNWYQWTGYYYSLKFTEMKFR